MAVDAPWGTGKTTFLNLWNQHLHNSGFAVVKFSAWENDFCNDPFVALCAELTAEKDIGIDTGRLMEAGNKLMKHITWNALGQLIAATTAGTINLSELVNAGEADIDKRLEQYQDAKNAIESFRDTLQEMAAPAPSDKQHGPFIILIDELDRCRPSYAVELLEIAKHIFSVNNIIFVLAINRSELAHSIRAIYGAGFDADGYLRRFFDVDFRLPDPDKTKFVEGLLDAIQISDYLARTRDPRAPDGAKNMRGLLQGFLGTADCSLRQIAIAIHRLGLVFASLPDDKSSAFSTASVALVLRTINEDLYYQFKSGEIHDDTVIENIFNSLEIRKLQSTWVGQFFERAIILAEIEMTYEHDYPSDMSECITPLMKKYKDQTAHHEEKPSDEYRHAESVLNTVKGFIEQIAIPEESLDFKYSVNRIELLTKALVE